MWTLLPVSRELEIGLSPPFQPVQWSQGCVSISCNKIVLKGKSHGYWQAELSQVLYEHICWSTTRLHLLFFLNPPLRITCSPGCKASPSAEALSTPWPICSSAKGIPHSFSSLHWTLRPGFPHRACSALASHLILPHALAEHFNQWNQHENSYLGGQPCALYHNLFWGYGWYMVFDIFFVL